MAEGKRSIEHPVYNCHMHLFNFAITPDDYYDSFFYRLRWIFPWLRTSTGLISQLSKARFLAKISESLPSRLNERLIKSPTIRVLAELASIVTGVPHALGFRRLLGRRVSEMLNLFKMDMNDVADYYVSQMDEAGINVATPLMIDLGRAMSSSRAEVPFEYQVALIQEQMIRHPGKFLPFVMFDPRREEGVRMAKDAVMRLGFGGVKVYPALGFHPDPESPVNDINTCQALRAFYRWAEDEGVPITVHCSQGGAVSDIVSYDPSLRNNLARPYNWRRVLEEFRHLVLNLAHFGGYYGQERRLTRPVGVWGRGFLGHSPLDLSDDRRRSTQVARRTAGRRRINYAQRSRRWRNDILDLMRSYRNVYTDVSYHDRALLDPDDYFDELIFLLTDEKTKQLMLQQKWEFDEKTAKAKLDGLRIDPELVEMLKDPAGKGYPVDEKILFGSDWPQTAHTWNDKEWARPFQDQAKLPAPLFKKLAYDNPTRFLKHSLLRIESVPSRWGVLEGEPQRVKDLINRGEL